MSLLVFGIETAIASVGIWLVSGIYKVASWAFQIFLILANGELLHSSEYEILFTNCYVILGVVMLFIIAFSLLKSIINPDDQKQGTAAIKKMIINLVTSGIMIAILPTVFAFAFDFQTSILGEQNVLGRFFGFGSTISESENNGVTQVKQGANMIVNSVFTAFFNVNIDECDGEKIENNSDLVNCQRDVYGADSNYSFYTAMNKVNKDGSFGTYAQFAENASGDAPEIEFNFLLSLIGGLILIYIGVSYCFDMAVRLVKLVFYQMIAPIPIMFRVIPEGKLSGTFNQWLKITVTCYLEVFIRIFVLYFCIYLCVKLVDSPFLSFSSFSQYGFFTWLFTKAFVFMGVVTFMKQAPKLISEITGIDSGNMKLGIKDKLAAGGAFTAGALIGGGATALTRNAVNAVGNIKKNWKGASGLERAKMIAGGITSTFAGGASGMARSAKFGWNAKSGSDMKGAASKGATAAVNARDNRAAYKARHGGNLGGVIVGHAQDTLYDVGRWAGFNNIDSLLAQQKTIDTIQSERKAIDSESFDIIDGDLAKGKNDSIYSSLIYDKTTGTYQTNNFATSLGITHNMKELRAKKAAVDAARASGIASDIEKAEVDYASYRADWADELRNISLLGEESWEKLGTTADGKSMQADLAKLRISSEKYRETLARNYTASYVSSQKDSEAVLDKNANLNIKDGVLKQIKDDMKIEQTQIATQINRIRQKDQERQKDK